MSGKKKFDFPAYYSMAPFFTIQPVRNTRRKQTQLWGDLIVNYCRHNKIYEFNVAEAANSPIFKNESINHLKKPDAHSGKLSMEGIKYILEELVTQGNGEWVDKDHSHISILWRRIDHWSSLIYKWVSETGQLGTVLTVWEIQNGESAQNQEFYNLDLRVLMKALQLLERQGKAQIFSGTSEENLGVKFFSV